MFTGNFYATAELYDGLKATAKVALAYFGSRFQQTLNPYYGQFAAMGGQAVVEADRMFTLNQQYLLTYVKDFGAHSVDILAGYESYNYTTVAVSTLCYYMQPTFVIIASAFIFKERITLRKAICVILALVGMVFVSGIVESGIPTVSELKGVLFGLGAAVIYTSIILVNQKLGGIDAYTKTVIQLFSAAVTILPYILLTEDVSELTLDARGALLLGIVAVVHTGIAYFLYFGSMGNLKAQTIAIMSYIDPVTAIILSALFLREPITPAAIIGALLILGAAFVSEFPSRKS